MYIRSCRHIQTDRYKAHWLPHARGTNTTRHNNDDDDGFWKRCPINTSAPSHPPPKKRGSKPQSARARGYGMLFILNVRARAPQFLKIGSLVFRWDERQQRDDICRRRRRRRLVSSRRDCGGASVIGDEVERVRRQRLWRLNTQPTSNSLPPTPKPTPKKNITKKMCRNAHVSLFHCRCCCFCC